MGFYDFEDESSEEFYDCYESFEEIKTDDYPSQSMRKSIDEIVDLIIGDDLDNHVKNFFHSSTTKNTITLGNNIKNTFLSDLHKTKKVSDKIISIIAQFSYEKSNALIIFLTATHKAKEHIRVNANIIDHVTQQIVPGNQFINNHQSNLQTLNTVFDFFANTAFISLLCVKNGSAYWLQETIDWQEPSVANTNSMADGVFGIFHPRIYIP